MSMYVHVGDHLSRALFPHVNASEATCFGGLSLFPSECDWWQHELSAWTLCTFMYWESWMMLGIDN